MAITRKRKHENSDDTAPTRSQTSITAFGTIGKAGVVHTDAKKHKTSHDDVLRNVNQNIVSHTRIEHKRKRSVTSDSDQHDNHKPFARSRPNPQITQKSLGTAEAKIKYSRDAVPSSPSETPSKRAAAMLNRLNLDKTKPIPFSLQRKSSISETQVQAPEADEPLPGELRDLEQLYAAFVHALSLCCAHGGASTSIELYTLLPAVTKHWKKRAVDLEDLRRLLSLDHENFVLEYCGQAGVRLTLLQARGRSLIRGGGLMDVENLKKQFGMALKEQWLDWAGTRHSNDREAGLFLEQLPLAEVRKNESVQAAMPFFKRGQRRLADIRESQASAAAVANDKLQLSQMDAQGKTLKAVQNRGSNLLDRVLARQAANADLPAGLTPQQLQRNAALQRIEDVTRVLNLLAGNKIRASFSLQSITQHLQQSLRNPISRDEVERCLLLMSEEITPGFVNVLQTGAVQGVVVNRTGRIGLAELRSRVGDALA